MLIIVNMGSMNMYKLQVNFCSFVYVTDMHIIEVCKDLIMQLAVVRNDIIQDKMLPTLVSIIQQRTPDTLPSNLQPVSNVASYNIYQTLVN